MLCEKGDREDIWFFFFSMKDRNLFHRVDTIGNIFTSGRWCSRDEINFDFSPKKNIFCLFHASFNPFWEKIYQNPAQFFSVIPRGVPLPHSNV